MRRWTFSLTAALLAAAIALPATANVEDGVEAWRAGDYREAVMLWLPAAARGNPHALYNLGLAYRQGKGVPADLSRAEDFFRRAAEKGHAPARTYYGILLAKRGEEAKALDMWQQSAAAGDRHARYMLGIRYFTGQGVPKDLPRAYAYMLLASNEGLTQAGRVLRRMNSELSEADRTAGRQLAVIEAGHELSTDGVAADARSPAVRAAEQLRREGNNAARADNAAATVVAAAGTNQTSRPARAAVQRTTGRAAASPPADSANFRIQLGAYARRDQAEQAWTAMTARHPALLQGIEPVYTPFEGGIRLRIGAYRERGPATEFCGRMKAAGQPCFVTATGS